MKNVMFYAEGYRNAPDTTNAVKEYLKKNKPTGPYVELINVFRGHPGKEDDVDFYLWLCKEYKAVSVFKPLSEEVDLFDFVFNFNGISNPIYNQKWHFYVSYLAYREYATRVKAISGVAKYTVEKGVFMTQGITFRCPELKMWYDYRLV